MTSTVPRRVLVLVLVGILGGLLSGAFGVGGGIVMVPLLMWFLGMDQRRAAATSLVAIVPTAIAGSIQYLALGHLDVVAGLLVAVGGIGGSLIGTRLLRTLPLGWLRWLFIALLVVVGGMVLAGMTRFGRSVYAIGGGEQSALLIGLPVAATRIGVYALSGFCSALAGVVYTFYMLSGYSLHATGLELDAIAAVVIGGTLLAGGSGYVLGTLVGVLVLGLIQTLIVFDGSLSSWWTRIAIGALLLVFCVLQRLLLRTSQRRQAG